MFQNVQNVRQNLPFNRKCFNEKSSLCQMFGHFAAISTQVLIPDWGFPIHQAGLVTLNQKLESQARKNEKDKNFLLKSVQPEH